MFRTANFSRASLRHLFQIAILAIIFAACQKDIQLEPSPTGKSGKMHSARSSLQLLTTSCVEDQDIYNRPDTILIPTILGAHLINNPYSVANMQQAAINLYGTAAGVAENKWYVRLKPSNITQLNALDSLDIELFDYPLDYEVVQEGDYYNDGVTPSEEIPWLYAVVDPGFSPPAGITFELLQHIHVPQLAAMENEAFSITGNPVDDPSCDIALNTVDNGKIIQPDTYQCPEGYHWDYGIGNCVPDENQCSPGFHWDYTTGVCVPNTPPEPDPVRQPTGTIRVYDTQFGTYTGVRIARVVARRFLKVERTYTNDQGAFNIYKEFNKATLLVRFRNGQATVRSIRRARLWQMLFPVEINMGKYAGALNNITYDINYTSDALSAGARFWAAATTANAVQEYHQYANQLNIGTPPGKLKIILTNWRLMGTAGMSPMFAKRFVYDLPEIIIRTYQISNYSCIAGGVYAFIETLKAQIDIAAGYNLGGNDVTAGSDRLDEVAYHELTHAAHYNKVGHNWWETLVSAEVHEMIFSSNPPYGNGDNGSSSEIIGLAESWAYHMGHFLTDAKFAMNSAPCYFQKTWFYNNSPVSGLSSHLNLLETFNPNKNDDPDKWIPTGLYYDLIDQRNESNPIIDGVSGYNNTKFFDAMDNDVKSVTQFRERMILENGANANLTNLFAQYYY